MVSSNHSHMAQYFATWSEVVLPLYLARRRSGGLWGWWGSMGAYQTKNGLLEALASSRKVVMGAKVLRPISRPASPWRPPRAGSPWVME